MTTRTAPAHGERACYLRGCRREECRTAHSRYMARLKLDHHRGHRRRTAARPVHDHIQQLLAQGWTCAGIARTAGCGTNTVKVLAALRRPTTNRDIATAILAVTGRPERRSAPAIGSIRRIRALVAIGHTMTSIGQATGLAVGIVSAIAADRQGVSFKTAAAITAAYKTLSAVPGKSTAARALAQQRGWHGPLAWEDPDDPDEQPDTDTGEAPKPTRRDKDLAAEVRHLSDGGTSPWEIAARVGRTEKYIRDQLSGTRAPGWRQRELTNA